MKFREHRGSLDESMATMVEIETQADLLKHLQEKIGPVRELKIEPYAYDERIGWHTWLVTGEVQGERGIVIGFSDGPAPP